MSNDDRTPPLRMVTAQRSADGGVKYVWELPDGESVESVYLRLMDRGAAGPSMCVSSQVGCAVRCTFCATGVNGLMRNLRPDEIIGQVVATLDDVGGAPAAFDVSFMGMGEPLHNLPAVLETVSRLPGLFPHSDVHVSLSTIGIPAKIAELAHQAPHVALQISLHGTRDETRRSLIPMGRAPIADILEAARHYADVSGRPVNLNYLLFDGVNDSVECAGELAELLDGDPRLRLKLSHYNPVDGSDLGPVSRERIRQFMALCQEHGVDAFFWESMAVDVLGGCGQLKRQQEVAGRA